MSDYEEPAAKISKIDESQKDEDEMDEGHEEWLSEGILTDDDYNPAGDQNKADSNVSTSHDDTAPSLHEGELNEDIPKHAPEEKIEETLDNLQNTNQTELPDELGAFLIRKTDGKVIDSKREESEIDESTKQSDDDGHDTDELLRMLGGDDNSKKDVAKKLEQKRTHESQSSDDDDDEYIFEGAKVARLKVAKNAILKKYPSKAMPEETSDRDTDMSSDEGLTVKRMFGVTRKSNVASKSTAKSGINALKTITKKVVSLQKPGDKKPVTSTPLPKPIIQTKVVRAEPEEIINEEEFLEEEQFDLDEEFESDMEESQQRIMRPERMDEEVPSDVDSHSEDDSLYDELPSSDSDDLNEWFTLDIRSERAGDYIPLLGAKAHQLLQAEKQRVSTRLTTLKQSVSALNKSSTQQAEMLRRATLQLAELDAALKA
ncbi:unnamed protein product, partial [Brenthis ino]